MNDVRVSELLAQMRTMRLQAQGQIPLTGAPPSGAGAGTSFMEALRSSVDAVNGAQLRAEHLAQAFESGDAKVDLSDVMVAIQKANVSFQAMTQVRNKLVSAYQDIMNMAI
jgi:flagellar hook-basal body complex protein FliE